MSCKCPTCGSVNFKVGKICSKTKELVCIDCCRKCEYYFYNEAYIAHGCTYGRENWHSVRSEDDAELIRIQHEIEKKYQQVDYFYMNDKPYISRKIEAEINALQYQAAKIKARMAI